MFTRYPNSPPQPNHSKKRKFSFQIELIVRLWLCVEIRKNWTIFIFNRVGIAHAGVLSGVLVILCSELRLLVLSRLVMYSAMVSGGCSQRSLRMHTWWCCTSALWGKSAVILAHTCTLSQRARWSLRISCSLWLVGKADRIA
jgi:hypothetical protein